MATQRKKAAPNREATENVRVVVRVRPLSETEAAAGDEEVMRIADQANIQVLLPIDEDFAGNMRHTVKKFQLDGCLDQSTTQQQCFNDSGVKTLLDSALEGFSATVFAYGQTGSGKTYTMTGVGPPEEGGRPGYQAAASAASDGVIPRSVRYIFDQVHAREESIKYTIRASFLEIYNEMVRDLWNPSSGGLSIREYPPGYWRGFYVEDLYIFECTNADDMLFMLAEGMAHRAVGSHNLNKDSSRSHSMLTFYIESEEQIDSDPYVKFGKISFVDLAGSERLKDTQSDSVGSRQDFQATFRSRARMKGDEMLKETGNINKSLFTLGKVISALGDASKSAAPHYVPYRDSKLTKLLMDSLGGSSKALMFACCSPAGSYLEETLNTLQYAARARNITNKPAVQVDPHEELVRELRKDMKLLKLQNGQLIAALRNCMHSSHCPQSMITMIEQGLAAIHLTDFRPAASSQQQQRRQQRQQQQPAPQQQSNRRRGQHTADRRRADAHDYAPAAGRRQNAHGGGREHGMRDMRQAAADGQLFADSDRSSRREGRRSAGTSSRDDCGGSMPRRRGGRDHARHLQAEAATTAAAGVFLADSQSQDSGGGGGGGGHSSSSFSDWKDELDDEPRELYRQLGLALYRATSQEEMSAAMRGLQQFEREHRHAAAATQQAAAAAAAAGGGSREDPEQAFKKMAMHYYREDGLGHGLDGRGAARTLDLLKRERRRGAKANGSTM